MLYEAADRYFAEHMNGRITLPIKAWREERDKLLAERFAHVGEYYGLRDDVQSIEVLRRSAERLMGEIAPERKAARNRDLEL